MPVQVHPRDGGLAHTDIGASVPGYQAAQELE
jgi:hypothetical protein